MIDVVMMEFYEDDSMEMVATGKVKDRAELSYKTCLVKFDWSPHEVEVDSNYIFPCDEPVFIC